MSDKPIDTLRDGAVKATIWKNTSEKGDFYNVIFSRSYKDENDEWHDTDSFSHSDMLKICRLSDKAYDRILELKQS